MSRLEVMDNCLSQLALLTLDVPNCGCPICSATHALVASAFNNLNAACGLLKKAKAASGEEEEEAHCE